MSSLNLKLQLGHYAHTVKYIVEVISILNALHLRLDLALLQGVFENMLYLQAATFGWVVVFSFIEFQPCSSSNNLRLKITFVGQPFRENYLSSP